MIARPTFLRPTIGQRVLLALLGAFVLVWLVLLGYVYWEFRQQLAVDQGLKKLGRGLGSSLARVRTDDEARLVVRSAAVQFQHLRISGNPVGSTWMELRRRDDGQLLYRSPAIGDGVLDAPALQVVERDFGGAWYWVHGVEAGRWSLQLAEPRITAGWVLERNAGRLLPYLLLAFPTVLLPVWLAVRHGLRPLQRLADRIARRNATDLSPIGYDPPYAELRPLTAALERMLRQLRDKMAQERAFVHDAAHELRTPMAVIAAQAHALSGAQNDGERGCAQHQLEQAIGRASHLTQQLLDLALLDDAQPAVAQRVDVAQFARQLLAQAAPQAMARGIELTLDAPDSLDVWLDRPALQSILENLLHNAIRYVQDGARVAVALGMEGRAGEASGAGRPGAQRLLLDVADDGPGIPVADRERVFERFRRGQGAHETRGSGLGLAIVKQALHRMGGQVRLGPGLDGRGVAFHVAVPVSETA